MKRAARTTQEVVRSVVKRVAARRQLLRGRTGKPLPWGEEPHCLWAHSPQQDPRTAAISRSHSPTRFQLRSIRDPTDTAVVWIAMRGVPPTAWRSMASTSTRLTPRRLPGRRDQRPIGNRPHPAPPPSGEPLPLLASNIMASIRILYPEAEDAAMMTEWLNREVERFTDPDRSATLFLARLDVVNHRCRYVNAGHDPPIVIAPNEEPRQPREMICTASTESRSACDATAETGLRRSPRACWMTWRPL